MAVLADSGLISSTGNSDLMGVEAFGVSIQFVELGIEPRVEDVLTNFGQISTTTKASGAGYDTLTGEYSDGTHFIEFQLSREMASNHCNLAVRFSLCSYVSIDKIFVDLTNCILASSEAEVWLMTSALKQKPYYLPGDERWLISALPDEIIAMREHWQSLFGFRQGAVRVKDSFWFAGVVI